MRVVGRSDAGLEATERAFAHARQAGYLPPGSMGNRAGFRFFGTTPASELLAWLDEDEPRAGRDQLPSRLPRRVAGDARSLRRSARDPRRGARGARQSAAGHRCSRTSPPSSPSGSSSGPGIRAAAAAFGADGCRLHEELGSERLPVGAAVALAQALYALDRLDEAEAWADRAAELGTSDDPGRRCSWRQVRAKVLARRGEHPDAERLAREAVAIGDETDGSIGRETRTPTSRRCSYSSAKRDEAAAALEQALGRYERKENLVVRRARANAPPRARVAG